MSYVLAFLGFAALIILHEAGHFVAAKVVGMRVERFSLFFGPMIVKGHRGETEYGIGVIPLGGYVKISGMTPDDAFLPAPATPTDGAPTVAPPPQPDPRAYVNQPVWKRIVVIGAGPAVNLVIAFVILWAVVLSNGVFVNHGYSVSGTTNGSPAASVLKPGEQLVSVNGRTSENGILAAISATHCRNGATTDGCIAYPAVTIAVKRDGKAFTYMVNARYSAKYKRPLVGFEYGPGYMRPVGAASAVGWSFRGMGDEIGSTFSALGHIFQAKERKQLHSVVGIYDVTQQYIQQDPSEGLEILALVSLALGVFNLLPFLPLDGGHIFWAVAEKLRGGKKISLQTMERASFVGIALMLALFVIGFSNDISALGNGGLNIH